jgi:hypothetical protein
VNREIPFDGLHWFFDHAETISDKNIARVAALGGGIAVQHRMAYQGEYFVERYGHGAAEHTPPIGKMLQMGAKVSAGTDATRVASYNPWVSLYWLVTGKTIGGTRLYPDRNRLDRETALRMWTENVTWFSNEEGKKGRLVQGQFGDLAVLSDDYFAVPEDQIKAITSVLTIVAGRVVHAAEEFKDLTPPLPPAMPDWSPVRTFGGYQRAETGAPARAHARACVEGCVHGCGVHGHAHQVAWTKAVPASDPRAFWGALGCSCFAF